MKYKFLSGIVGAAAIATTATVLSLGGSHNPVIYAAGDIATCGQAGASLTAQLIPKSGTILTLGDNAYGAGTSEEFQNCYQPTWGSFKKRTKPSPGNHDYGTPGAAGYFDYFGKLAGTTTKGYYTFKRGSWLILSLNGNCTIIDCAAEANWIKKKLKSSKSLCQLAYWHQPRYSSGPHGNDLSTQPLWDALYEKGADVILSGHDHDYERFAPQDPHGNFDSASGITEFVVGTGGASHYTPQGNSSNSIVTNGDTFGVLKMTLASTSFDWQFIPVTDGAFTDSGHAECHT